MWASRGASEKFGYSTRSIRIFFPFHFHIDDGTYRRLSRRYGKQLRQGIEKKRAAIGVFGDSSIY